MTLNDLIDSIYTDVNKSTSSTSINKLEIRRVLASLGDVTTHELGVELGEVPLPGIGKLKSAVSAARTGRNPKTGETIAIPAKNVVKFVAAKSLKDAIA